MRISKNNVYNNFITGETISMEKLKPEQDMRNSCVIQLYDSVTGKLKEECVAENIIANYFSKMIMKRVGLFNTFTYYPSQGSFDNRTLFGQLVLSDYNGVEDADLRCFKGNTIGWADKYTSYVGTDTKRGSVNVSESGLISSKKVKFVFDFPTHVANGTINTLFWMPSDHTTDVQVQPCVAQGWYFDSGSVLNPPTTGVMCVKGDKIYHTLNGIIYSTKMSYLTSRLVRNPNTTTVEADLTFIDSGLKGIQWDDIDSVWWVFGDVTNKMYKLDTSFNVIASYSIASDTYFNTKIQWVLFQGSFYSIKYISATEYNLHKFSRVDLALTSTTNLYAAGGNFATYGTKSDGMYLFNDDNNLFIMASATGTGVRSYSASIIEAGADGMILGDYGIYWGTSLPSMVTYNSEYKMFETTAAMHEIYKRPSSQTLLPTPITKTSSDFMKIAFTFDISNLEF